MATNVRKMTLAWTDSVVRPTQLLVMTAMTIQRRVRAETGCTVTFNLNACDDGNACTINDSERIASKELAGAEVICDDDNPCTTDSCAPDTVYSITTQKSVRTTMRVPSMTIVMQAHVFRAAANCDDDNVCTDDSCDVLFDAKT